MTRLYAFIIISFFLLLPPLSYCEEGALKEPKFVGSFYDVQVPEENYYFIKGVQMVFGGQPRTPEEAEAQVWDQLLLSFESFRRGIAVEDIEVDDEVSKILQSENVQFDWKADKEAFEKWAKERLNEPGELLRNQIRHLIQVKKLRDEVMAAVNPVASDDETRLAFLYEQSSLDVELVQFDVESDARAFYDKVRKKPLLWDEEKKKRPDDFKRPGGVTLQFLLDFWKIPGDAMLKMVKMKKDSFYQPEPIYKGYGVFKIMGGTPADESKLAEAKERYSDKIKASKGFQGYNDWFDNFKKEANVKVFPVEKTDEKDTKETEVKEIKNEEEKQ